MTNRPAFEEVCAKASRSVRFSLLLSIYYHLGEGTPPDEVASEQWFERAYLGNDAEFLCQLGELREQGHLLPRDFVAANRAYRRVMTLDKAKGSYMLARLALNPAPENPFRNLRTAFTHLMLAAKLGHIPSAVLLAQHKMHAGWRYRLSAVLEGPAAMFSYLRAVLGGDSRRLWRYADVFRRTTALAKYVGSDRAYVAARSLDELNVELLAPDVAPEMQQTSQL